MSIVHLLATIQATVVVNTETKQVEEVVYDPDSIVYEDPIIALDGEGGPVSDHLKAEAYDVAEFHDQRDWHLTEVRIGDVVPDIGPTSINSRRKPGEKLNEAKELAREIVYSEDVMDWTTSDIAYQELVKLVKGAHNAQYFILDAQEQSGLNPQTCIREPQHDGPCNGFPRVTCPGYENWLTLQP